MTSLRRWPYTLSPTVRTEFRDVLRWSAERFGAAASLRYEELFIQALFDLSENPCRLGSRNDPGMSDDLLLYHLSWSKDRVSTQRVAQPRHLLLYRLSKNGFRVLRVLHDSRDLPRLTRSMGGNE